MRRLLIILILACVGLLALRSEAPALEVTSARPHCFFTAADRQRLQGQRGRLAALDQAIAGMRPPADAEDFLLQVTNCALAFQLGTPRDDQAKRNGLALLSEAVKRLAAERRKRQTVLMDGFDVQVVLTALALGYDAFHAELSAAQRSAIADELLDWAGWIDQHFDRRHGWANNDFGNHKTANLACVTVIAAALAPDERKAIGMLKRYRRIWVDDIFPCIAVNGADDGGWSEGVGYNTGQASHVINALDVIRNATGDDLWPDCGWLRENGTWMLQMRQPDGTWLAQADMWSDRPTWREVMLLGRYAREFNDGRYLRGMEELSATDGFLAEPKAIGWRLLWEPTPDASMRAKPLETFAHFAGIGVVTARSSWNADAGFLSFRCGPVISPHQHADQNGFTLFHHAPLALDAGVYDDFWSAHSFNYYRRTIAHNTLVIRDPQERFTAADKLLQRNGKGRALNDGGQYRFNPELNEIATYRKHRNEWHASGIETATAFAGGCYLHGEAGAAYRENKVKRYDRQLIALWGEDGHHLVIRDRIQGLGRGLQATLLLQTPLPAQADGEQRWLVDPTGPARMQVHLLSGFGRVEVVGAPQRYQVDGQEVAIERLPKQAPPPGGPRLEMTMADDTALWVLSTGTTKAPIELHNEGGNQVLTIGACRIVLPADPAQTPQVTIDGDQRL